MSIYNSVDAWHVVLPVYNLLRELVPEEERGKRWEDISKQPASSTEEQRWHACADRLNDMISLCESYGHTSPIRMLAEDWLIECGTMHHCHKPLKEQC